jgi:hypothetical protein
MDYDKEQASREVSAFLHSTGGLAWREQCQKLQDGYVRQVFSIGTSVSQLLSNPAIAAEAVAKWQGIEAEKRRLDKIMEEGKRNDD